LVGIKFLEKLIDHLLGLDCIIEELHVRLKQLLLAHHAVTVTVQDLEILPYLLLLER
jgi:hypothetical protein